MKTINAKFIACLLIVLLVSSTVIAQQPVKQQSMEQPSIEPSPIEKKPATNNCRFTTFALDSMQQQAIALYKHNAAIEYELNVKIAGNRQQRWSGFQHICEQTIKKQGILFLFANTIKPKFHMHNVHAPLDIAFIDANGELINIQTMYPYNSLTIEKPLYGVDHNVQAVLEVHQGFFKKHGITVGWKLKDLPQLINENTQ